ncbi:hypothetical protein K502DRAFT_353937, partial [Neoconidiobolus thromboides FSU 785]
MKFASFSLFTLWTTFVIGMWPTGTVTKLNAAIPTSDVQVEYIMTSKYNYDSNQNNYYELVTPKSNVKDSPLLVWLLG